MFSKNMNNKAIRTSHACALSTGFTISAMIAALYPKGRLYINVPIFLIYGLTFGYAWGTIFDGTENVGGFMGDYVSRKQLGN
jgi:hypothetical protein